jgi:hypothetical protein
VSRLDSRHAFAVAAVALTALCLPPPAAMAGSSADQIDPVTGLGVRNPVCDKPAEIRDPDVRISCEATGAPETKYPTSNYGFDVWIDSGLFHPGDSFVKAFVMILNGVWLGLIFVLKLILQLLGLAFGLNPFGEGQTMREVTSGIGRLYDRVTDPWLTTLVVIAGIWFAHRGLIQRQLAAGAAGTLAALALLIAGLWVVQQPRASVGQLADLSNDVALNVISAPQSGSVSRPTGTYAEAMSRTWARLVEVPFAGLDFSDVRWALSKPSPEAVERANAGFCGIAFISEEKRAECLRLTHDRYGTPRRVIDLYLRDSPGGSSRKALWEYFKDEDEFKAKVATQGSAGALTRLSMLALFAVALLGAILLLAWLAIRLFAQAAIAFVLLLMGPFALFFPLLGDSGRRAFKTWGLTLLGATVAKVVYAAFLSVVLLGISIFGQVGGSTATGFLLACAFTWAVFLKRDDLIGWMSVGDVESGARGGHGFSHAKFMALHQAHRLPGSAIGAMQGLGRAGWRTLRGTGRVGHTLASRGIARTDEGAEVTRRTARESLRRSARVLGEQRDLVGGRELVNREGPVGRRAPVGRRLTEEDLDRLEAEDRELLTRPRRPGDHVDHVHRVGYTREGFEQLHDAPRHQAEEKIDRAIERDRQRLYVTSKPPGRVVGRSQQAAEWVRQRREGAAPDRRAHLQQLRRERREEDLNAMVRRRNLSRGG